MKIFKVTMIALVALLGLSSCEKHNCDDHSADLTGTWTYVGPGYAEALVISADGSVVSTGVEGDEYWENVKGNIVAKDSKVTMTFEDNDNFEGHFDIIPGEAFSIYSEDGERMTYRYCKEDLSEEIVGMWVCNEGPQDAMGGMAIQIYTNDGKLVATTNTTSATGGSIVNKEDSYFVIGDMLVFKIADAHQYIATRLVYAPNGTSLGDIMTQKMYLTTDNGVSEATSSWLRVKESLNLAGMKYDYSKTFVTNVKGADKDIEFMDYTFNFSKMDGVMLNNMLKSVLFAFEFPDTKTIRYNYHYNGLSMTMDAPVSIEGNKVTLKMSQRDATLRDVDLYMFQDVDNCQLHMYMHTYAFINFFGNMKITMLSQAGKLDKTDAAAVKTEFDRVHDVVKSINVSLVFDAGK